MLALIEEIVAQRLRNRGFPRDPDEAIAFRRFVARQFLKQSGAVISDGTNYKECEASLLFNCGSRPARLHQFSQARSNV